MSKLNLDQRLIENSRNAAKNIAEEVQKFIDGHTTVADRKSVV